MVILKNHRDQKIYYILSEKDLNNDFIKEQNSNLLKINNKINDIMIENEGEEIINDNKLQKEIINDNNNKNKGYYKFKSLYSDKEHVNDEESKISNLININIQNEKEKENEEEDFDFENHEENENITPIEEKKVNEEKELLKEKINGAEKKEEEKKEQEKKMRKMKKKRNKNRKYVIQKKKRKKKNIKKKQKIIKK